MKTKWFNLSLLLLALIIIDQLIKNIIYYKFSEIVSINNGILFGFVTNVYIVGVLLISGSIVLSYLLFKSKNIDLSLILVLSGAISNIIDRFTHGGVIDYIHLVFWTNFNLADIYIVAGVCIYIYKLFFIIRYKTN